MRNIKVMLVDDHTLVREGLRAVINAQPDMEVVAEASNGKMALEIASQVKPDIIVMDISLPDFNGLEITAQIKRLSDDLRCTIEVIILSMYAKENLIHRALSVGATGYVSKNAPTAEIVSAIKTVLSGTHYLSPEISAIIIPNYIQQKTQSTASQKYDRLTQREQEIFRLLIEGHANQSVADLLSISIKTVHRHRANLMEKLEVRNFREMLHYAIRIGLLEATPEEEEEFI